MKVEGKSGTEDEIVWGSVFSCRKEGSSREERESGWNSKKVHVLVHLRVPPVALNFNLNGLFVVVTSPWVFTIGLVYVYLSVGRID